MKRTNLLDRLLASSGQSKKETAKQRRIANSAIALFAEKGYANTSTSEIADRAGVAEGTLFRRYGTKENLLLSIIVPFLKESLPELAKEVYEEVDPGRLGSFEQFVRELYLNRLRFLRENKDVFRVVVKEFVYRDELRRELMAAIDREIVVFLHKALDVYKARGQLPDVPNSALLKLAFPTIFSRFVLRFVLAPEEPIGDDEAEADEIARFIVMGIQGV